MEPLGTAVRLLFVTRPHWCRKFTNYNHLLANPGVQLKQDVIFKQIIMLFIIKGQNVSCPCPFSVINAVSWSLTERFERLLLPHKINKTSKWNRLISFKLISKLFFFVSRDLFFPPTNLYSAGLFTDHYFM